MAKFDWSPIYEPIADHATRRDCAECLRDYANVANVRSQPASVWRYQRGEWGAKDKSTRTPVCTYHARTP